ncbi:MAG: HNH endonuclease signature motif containing protein [Candidatus Accumulibacter phosphatis]
MVALLVLVCLASACEAGQKRNAAVAAAFQREIPCPSTGQTRGTCAGWIKDHIVPLCAGGPDTVQNMQWQTVEDAKEKDRRERRQCAARPNRSPAN